MSGSDDELNSQDKGLTGLPSKGSNWSSIKILNLSRNRIEEINASDLPPSLEYLDLSDNPLRIIRGLFPETLKHLILRNTNVGKLPVLPEALGELVINGSPISKKYYMSSQYKISDKMTIQRISGKPFEKYETMLNKTPRVRNNPVNNIHENVSNSEINMTTNLGGGAMIGGDPISTTPFVMILDHRETDDDIIYRVLTLNEGEKEVMKQFLEPYQPIYASEAPTIPLSSDHPPVYFNSSHGEDIFFEKPVPPGCMYITLHQCGISTELRNYYKIMLAFDDIPKGIKAKLRDPLKHKDELGKEFGFTFHIHYPEAPHPSDRTYLESIKYPFVDFHIRNKSFFIKSGMFSLDNDNHFTDTSKEQGSQQVTHHYTGGFTDNNLKNMYEDSIFPTYELVKRHLGGSSDDIYENIDALTRDFKCTQSWLFKKFPGIHYNFSCRAIVHHDAKNERINRRRRKSLEGAEALINAMSNNAIQSKATRNMFERYGDEGVTRVIGKLVNRGINLNEPTEYTELRPLQQAVLFMQKDMVAELVKVKGIDKSNTDNLLKEGLKRELAKTTSEKRKEQIREIAREIHRLLHPPKAKTLRRNTFKRKTRRRNKF